MRYEDFLPLPDESTFQERSSVLYKLLASGRASDINFDISNSPLSLLLYSLLTTEQINHLLSVAQAMFTAT